MFRNFQFDSCLKWLVISVVFFGSLSMLPTQTEYWPFSSYPMFNFRFDIPDKTKFVIFGVKENSELVEIHDQRVLGAVKNGYLSRYCRKKIQENQAGCLNESLVYWAKRYKTFEMALPLNLQGFDKIKLIEVISGEEMAIVNVDRVSL